MRRNSREKNGAWVCESEMSRIGCMISGHAHTCLTVNIVNNTSTCSCCCMPWGVGMCTWSGCDIIETRAAWRPGIGTVFRRTSRTIFFGILATNPPARPHESFPFRIARAHQSTCQQTLVQNRNRRLVVVLASKGKGKTRSLRNHLDLYNKHGADVIKEGFIHVVETKRAHGDAAWAVLDSPIPMVVGTEPNRGVDCQRNELGGGRIWN